MTLVPTSSEAWTSIGRVFAIMGIFLAPIAVVLPAPYGVYVLAVDVGFANVASFLGIQIHVATEKILAAKKKVDEELAKETPPPIN